MLKVFTFIVFITLISCNCSENNKKYKNIVSFPLDSIKNNSILIKDSTWFSKLIKSKDYSELNRFINPELGVTILFSWGTNPCYIKLDSFLENKEKYSKTFIPYWIYEDFLNQRFIDNRIEIKFLIDPVFQCDSVIKYGCFNDTGVNLNILSTSIKELINIEKIENNFGNQISKLTKDIILYEKLEMESVRIIITKQSMRNKNIIEVFHITYINNKPYLYLVDCYSYDCSV
jgi:hypothetical protein